MKHDWKPGTLLYPALLIIPLLATNLFAQQGGDVDHPVVNWGFKVGFNALSTTHYRVYYEGAEIEDKSNTDQVGFSGTLFLRINLARFFMQPEASWNCYKETCRFSIPSGSEDSQDTNLGIEVNSGNAIVLVGYNIVKEGPYLFNCFVGPSLKYNYHCNYEISDDLRLQDRKADYNINAVIGFSVHISKLYIDVRYEISRPNTNIYFNEIQDTPDYFKGVSIEKNENILGFSCGMMF